ncbi:MAG: trimeric intracellular cation channel family protein [Bacteroidales bacterium]|nr:trimeric intracellular cation channel family protein [Bacteroidales bacterium]
MSVSDIIPVLDYVGTFAFAISGALAAARKQFDLFGGIFLGFVTAIGGGTLRDIMLNQPVAWLHDMWYFYLIVGAVAFTFIARKTIEKYSKTLFLFDTIGISVFTIIGMQKGLIMNISPMLAVMMGILTAVFGGIVRDLMCVDIPLIFRKEIYATACLFGGLVYLLLVYYNCPDLISVIIAAVVIFTTRTLSVIKNWSLPKFK